MRPVLIVSFLQLKISGGGGLILFYGFQGFHDVSGLLSANHIAGSHAFLSMHALTPCANEFPQFPVPFQPANFGHTSGLQASAR